MKFNNLITTASSTSFILSQAVTLYSDILKSVFPKRFFTEVISTIEDYTVREYHREANDVAGQFQRKSPVLSLNPQFTGEAALYNDPFADDWKHINKLNGRFTDFRGHYPILYSDEEAAVYIFTLFKRLKFSIQTSIRLESKLQVWDTLRYLKDNLPFESNVYFNHKKLSFVIPNMILDLLAKRYELSLSTDKEQLLGLLQKGSYDDVWSLVDPAKGEDFIIYDYKANILSKFTGIGSNQGNKDLSNFSKENTIEFTAELDFPIPINFIYSDGKLESLGWEEMSTEKFFFYKRRKFGPINQTPSGKRIVFSRAFILNDEEKTEETRILDEDNSKDFSTTMYVEDGNGVLKPECIEYSVEDLESLSFGRGTGNSCLISSTKEENLELVLDTIEVLSPKSVEVKIKIKPSERDKLLRISLESKESKRSYGSVEVVSSDPEEESYITLRSKDLKDGEYLLKCVIISPLELSVYSIEYTSIFKAYNIIENGQRFFLNQILYPYIIDVIKLNAEEGIDNDSFFEYSLSTSNEYASELDFSINWESEELVIMRPTYGETYHLAFYADLQELKRQKTKLT